MESNGSHAKDKRPDSDQRSKDNTPTTSNTTTPPDNTNKSPKKRRKVNHGMLCHSSIILLTHFDSAIVVSLRRMG